MDATRVQDMIQADLDGKLSTAESAELARLLLQDPEARRLHDELRRTHTLLRTFVRTHAHANAAVPQKSSRSVRGARPRCLRNTRSMNGTSASGSCTLFW